MRRTDRFATVTTTNSTRCAARASSNGASFRPSRLVVVPNGLDTSLYRSDASRRAATRAARGARRRVPLALGRAPARPEGPPDAPPVAGAALPDPAVVAIAGDGPLRAPLEALAAQLGVDA